MRIKNTENAGVSHLSSYSVRIHRLTFEYSNNFGSMLPYKFSIIVIAAIDAHSVD